MGRPFSQTGVFGKGKGFFLERETADSHESSLSQNPDPGSLTMPSPSPGFLAALSDGRKLQDRSPLGRGLGRN